MTEPPEAVPTAGPADSDAWRLDTLAVRAGLDRSPHDETAEALYLTSGYVYASAEEAAAAFAGDIDRYSYSRVSNPTVTMLQERLRALEGAEACWATATGMAAVFNALVACVTAGDRIVAARGLFGSCFAILENLLPRFDVHTTFVDGPDLGQWEQAITDAQPAVVFFETPSNPMQELVDIAAVADLAHGVGARVIVDNVFATPLGQRPLDLGADVVVYSTTKHIDGQGRTLGGAILADEMFMLEHLTPFMRNTGPTISPFNAWVALKGLETLRLRVDHMEATAIDLATWLEGLPHVAWVRHPMLASHPQHDLARHQMTNGGSIVTLELDGAKERAFAFIDALRLIDISNNLGDAKSLVTHPATTTHHRMGVGNRTAMGITDGVVRLSIGLEDVEDLRDDLAQALSAR